MTRAEHIHRLAARYSTCDGRPTLSYVVGEGWMLVDTWHIKVNGTTVTVEAGFTFDLASVPRILWPLIGPMDCSIEAALLHDRLYRDHEAGGRVFKRREVDRFFYQLMRDQQPHPVPYWRRSLAWLAVRLFGWAAWKR